MKQYENVVIDEQSDQIQCRSLQRQAGEKASSRHYQIGDEHHGSRCGPSIRPLYSLSAM